jgi:hypothetical protein
MKLMHDWMQRRGSSFLLVLALAFTVIGSLLADRAARLEKALRQGPATTSVPLATARAPAVAR